MGYKVIEISDGKRQKMSDMVEDMLSIGGRLMSCLEEMGEDAMGERYPEDPDDDMDDEPMGERGYRMGERGYRPMGERRSGRMGMRGSMGMRGGRYGR